MLIWFFVIPSKESVGHWLSPIESVKVLIPPLQIDKLKWWQYRSTIRTRFEARTWCQKRPSLGRSCWVRKVSLPLTVSTDGPSQPKQTIWALATTVKVVVVVVANVTSLCSRSKKVTTTSDLLARAALSAWKNMNHSTPGTTLIIAHYKC